MRPDALVASLLDGDDGNGSERTLKRMNRRVESRSSPKPAPVSVPAPLEESSPPPPEAESPPEAVVEDQDDFPEPPAQVVSAAQPTVMPPVPIAPNARDLAEHELVDLILRAQRVSKTTGAPLEVCLEQLRIHLKPLVNETAPKAKVRRFEFQTGPDGLLTGAKMTDEE